MTIHIELNPEMEARIAREAHARGIPVESVATDLLEKALAGKTFQARSSQEEFRSFLDSLANRSSGASSLRLETFSRSMIYDEHD